MSIRYEGPNQTIKCPGCKQKIELFPNRFQDRHMTTIRCGRYADQKMRTPNDGCEAIIGLKLQLTADFAVYSMEEV